jgi:thiamine transport system permease protein
MSARQSPFITTTLVTAAFLPWLAVFFLPALSLLRAGQLTGNAWTFSGFFAGLVDPLLLAKVQFTAGQAGLSALISCLFGLPLGIFLRHSPRAADWLKIPFGVPTLVASAAWVSILSRTSTIYSFTAVLLAHVVLNIPWVASLVAEAAGSVPAAWDDLARSLGARTFLRWRTVYFPVIAPALFSAFSQVFILCSMSFTLVTLLGGGPPVETLETAIFASVRTGTLDLVTGANLALWQLVLSLLPWVALRMFWKPVAIPAVRPASGATEPRWHRVLALAWVAPYVVFFKDVEPAVLASSKFWVEIRSPLLLSLGLAISVGLIAVLWSALAIAALSSMRDGRRQKVVEVLFLLPSGVSTLTLSLGFWLAYSAWIDPFEGSLAALVVVQALIFFPLVFRWLWPLARLRSQAALDVARSLGASPIRAWLEVEWPRLRQPLIHSVALVSAASTGELAAVSFFSSERMVTLPLLVSRWLAQYRFEYAHGVAAILLVISVVLTLGSRWRS